MENIQLRKATSEDLMLLFKWVNDPLVRENSFNSNPISLEEHKIWFKNSMLDKNIKIFILTKEDKQIGQIRLILEADRQLLDYSIDVEYRGKGYGATLLELIEQECDVNLPLIGLVKFENIPSQKAFEKLGYKRILKENCFEYVKHLLSS